METTLHRQLKALYSGDDSLQEVSLRGYRIDAVVANRLVEIQYGSLGAIRDKVGALLVDHDVLVVKPLAARKYLVKVAKRGGRIISERYSPTRETFHHLFDDLVHFTGVFGHPRLTLEVVLTVQEERRIEARKRWHRSRDYRVQDRSLRHIEGRLQLRSTADLLTLLPIGLPDAFLTGDIAKAADIPRWLAQKMAYCLRETGAIEIVGKKRNSLLYRLAGNH